MIYRTAILAFASITAAASAHAQLIGSASGKGAMERPRATNPVASDIMAFSPHHSYAYSQGAGTNRTTWIVLTEKEPPVKTWSAAKDPAEARRLWCEKEKTAFAALKLDADWKVDLYFLCPANGAVNTEMLSSWNGLESIVVTFENRDDKRLKGTLRTGTGSCPGADGKQAYCTPTGNYAFDAVLPK